MSTDRDYEETISQLKQRETKLAETIRLKNQEAQVSVRERETHKAFVREIHKLECVGEGREKAKVSKCGRERSRV